MGIRDSTFPALPWQNGYAERLICTLRRECLEQAVIFSEMHLRRILSAYAAYYNQARTRREQCTVSRSPVGSMKLGRHVFR
jgi:hypothetical protein